jgi:hypothetical protein
MANSELKEAVQGRWLHSHEEDTPTEMVFRPAGFAFPPSRGRRGFELNQDGSCVETGIGPTDKPQHSRGQWQFEDGNKLTIRPDADPEATQILQVAAASPERLVVRR